MVIYVPKSTVAIIRDISHNIPLPMSRLVARAIDLQLDRDAPFFQELSLPTEYREYLYAAEASRLLDFLMKVPKGLDIDQIMLFRRDIRIPDKMTLLAAIQELLQKNLVEYFRPSRTTFNYGKDYQRLSVQLH